MGKTHSTESDSGASKLRDMFPEIDRAIDAARTAVMLECSRPYTVLDYISIPQPRTTRISELKGRLVEGHALRASSRELLDRAKITHVSWDDVDHVDWWGSQLSRRAKELRWKTQE